MALKIETARFIEILQAWVIRPCTATNPRHGETTLKEDFPVEDVDAFFARLETEEQLDQYLDPFHNLLKSLSLSSPLSAFEQICFRIRREVDKDRLITITYPTTESVQFQFT
jgi:hypothetical protein